MGLEFLLNIFPSILWGLFGTIADKPGQAPSIQETKPPVVVEYRLTVPSFVTSIPSGHYAGVSDPCGSLADSRNSAIDNAARQILSAVNASYAHRYIDRVSGSVRNPKRQVDDHLSKVAKGIVLGVESRIVKSAWSCNRTGRYVYFILVRYPDKLVSEMRRLSKGAKVVCQFVRSTDGGIELRLSEVNGVAVTLSHVDITVRKVNRHAGFISYYIMKVSKGSQARYSKAIRPVQIRGESRKIRLKLKRTERQMADYLLGSEVSAEAVIRGHDEIGRPVLAKVEL